MFEKCEATEIGIMICIIAIFAMVCFIILTLAIFAGAILWL
jgi:hypothetical protein